MAGPLQSGGGSRRGSIKSEKSKASSQTPGWYKRASDELASVKTSEKKKAARAAAKKRWKKVKTAVSAVRFTVRSKKFVLYRETDLMKNASPTKKKFLIIAFLLAMLSCGVLSAESKAAVFHMSSVGRWGNGEPYQFTYVWSMTLATFLAKLGLVFIHSKDSHHVAEEPLIPKPGLRDQIKDILNGSETESRIKMIWLLIRPILALIVISVFDMIGSTLASVALAQGVATSVFVVFKSAKIVFVAVASVIILRSPVSSPQWTALAIMAGAMTVAAFSEKKDKLGAQEASLLGPFLLLLGEFCHAVQIVLQEACVKHLHMEGGTVIAGSSVFGTISAILACIKMSETWTELRNLDGHVIGERPNSDPVDVMIMMSNNWQLAFWFILHIVALALTDYSAISLAKHVNSIARVLVDALKLMVMWLLGKTFWLLAILPYLEEPWKSCNFMEGDYFGSWMMVPAMMGISYSLLMYQKGVWMPIKYSKKDGLIIHSAKVVAVQVETQSQPVKRSVKSRKCADSSPQSRNGVAKSSQSPKSLRFHDENDLSAPLLDKTFNGTIEIDAPQRSDPQIFLPGSKQQSTDEPETDEDESDDTINDDFLPDWDASEPKVVSSFSVGKVGLCELTTMPRLLKRVGTKQMSENAPNDRVSKFLNRAATHSILPRGDNFSTDMSKKDAAVSLNLNTSPRNDLSPINFTVPGLTGSRFVMNDENSPSKRPESALQGGKSPSSTISPHRRDTPVPQEVGRTFPSKGTFRTQETIQEEEEENIRPSESSYCARCDDEIVPGK